MSTLQLHAHIDHIDGEAGLAIWQASLPATSLWKIVGDWYDRDECDEGGEG